MTDSIVTTVNGDNVAQEATSQNVDYQQLFLDTKSQIFNLMNKHGSLMPFEYQQIMNRSRVMVTDINRNDIELSHIPNEERYQHFFSVLLFEVNEILHKSHDMAEDRVIRGKCLDENEMEFIRGLTNLYNVLSEIILPNIELDTEGILSLNEERIAQRNMLHNRLLDMQSKLNEEVALKRDDIDLSQYNLKEDEIKFVAQRYFKRSGEGLVQFGTVIKFSNSDHSCKLRFIYLSRFSVLLSDAKLLMKQLIPLQNIVKDPPVVSLLKQKHRFQIVDSKDNTTVLFTKEAESWVNAIDSSLSSLLCPPVPKSMVTKSDSDCCDILVTIKKVESLRPSPKRRPDCPFFYLGIGNPEHFKQDKKERIKSEAVKKSRSAEFNETFTMKLTPSKELVLDVRFYSKLSGARNDFSYGVVNVPLTDLFLENDDERKEDISAWFEIYTSDGQKEGRVLLSIKMKNSSNIPIWLTHYQPFTIPILCSYGKFLIYENNPVILAGSKRDVVGNLLHVGNSIVLHDPFSHMNIYSMEKGSFLKKESVIRDENDNIVATMFHKMKTIRKKKIRLVLGNSEHLYSMEGGCFNNKTSDNEVIVYNVCKRPVASVVFCDKEDNVTGPGVFVSVLDPLVDKPLIIMFALYALRTN